MGINLLIIAGCAHILVFSLCVYKIQENWIYKNLSIYLFEVLVQCVPCRLTHRSN